MPLLLLGYLTCFFLMFGFLASENDAQTPTEWIATGLLAALIAPLYPIGLVMRLGARLMKNLE